MPLILVSPPTEEPVSISEAEEHLRVETADEYKHVERLITAARQYVEDYTWRALVTQTWELVLDEFPDGEVELRKGRLSSVTSITYYDTAGTLQTLAPAAYQVDDASDPGRVLPAPGASWPDTQAERVNAVRVRFVAGYGNAAAVPQAIKAAMLLLIGHLYEHRESEVIGTIVTPLNFAVDALLAPYRLHWVG
jgi:uncharacterized phiE125 gp8 family phage protein